MDQDQKEEHLKDARARLELELCRVHSKLKAPATGKVRDAHPPLMGLENPYEYTVRLVLPRYHIRSELSTGDQSHTFASHALLLLSDSALPLGSFAFSSGLESFLAHHPARPIPSIQRFLSLSLYSVASTVLPYLLAAYRDPTKLVHLDDTLDACTLCPVAHRASVAQGSALLTLWERAFRPTADPNDRAALALAQLAKGLKGVFSPDEEAPNGHFAPVWAVITAAMGISVKDSAYAFLLNHAKAVTSAAVRASMVGPYQAQGVLAGNWLRKEIAMCLEENWEVNVEDAGQGVPMVDIWIGRHEMLYSRIFNS